MPPLKTIVRFEVFRRDHFKCQYCGVEAPTGELHVDHVVPKKLGGTDDYWNLVTACSKCNMSKGSKSLLDPTVPGVSEQSMAIAAALSTIRKEFEAVHADHQVMAEHFWDEWQGTGGPCDSLPEDYDAFLSEMVGHGLSYLFITDTIRASVESKDPWATFTSRCKRELVANMYKAFKITKEE